MKKGFGNQNLEKKKSYKRLSKNVFSNQPVQIRAKSRANTMIHSKRTVGWQTFQIVDNMEIGIVDSKRGEVGYYLQQEEDQPSYIFGRDSQRARSTGARTLRIPDSSLSQSLLCNPLHIQKDQNPSST